MLEIPQPPKKLRILGNKPPDDYFRLCVVGPRKYSEYAEKACRQIISGLAGLPISIISGLAFGIDSIAHKTALENNIHAIVVPGSGLHQNAIYPQTHLHLAKEIHDSGGCLISEFADDFRAVSWGFPQRNRIMVGLSDATLIIEAPEKSGTMITARMTVECGHDLLVVPGSIFNLNSDGSNHLIKDGAHVICNSDDLIDFIGFQPKSKNIENLNLSTDEKILLKKLDTPIDFDTLLKQKILEVDQLNTTISSLEIKDLIQFVDGNICKKF